MSKQPKLQNWTKVAGAQGLYMRSGATAAAKNPLIPERDQEKTTVVLKSLEARMNVILQSLAKR